MHIVLCSNQQNCVNLNYVSSYLNTITKVGVGDHKTDTSDSADVSLGSGVSIDSAVELSSVSTSNMSIDSHQCLSTQISRIFNRLYGGLWSAGLDSLGDSLVLIVSVQFVLYFILILYRGIFAHNSECD